VNLIAVEAAGHPNLSPTLAMEADDIIVLDREFFRGAVDLVEGATVPPPSKLAPKGASLPASVDELDTIGMEFATQWVGETPIDEVTTVRRDKPRIPREVDDRLLRFAVARLKRTHLEDAERPKLRAAFWRVIDVELSDQGI
jgi:hypothetical protein